MRVISVGHALFAVTIMGLGLAGLLAGDFTPIWSGVPATWPAREALAYLCAAVALASGLGLLWQRSATAAARLLLAYLAIWMLLFRVSQLFVAPTVTVTWWACGDSAVMVAGVIVLHGWITTGQPGQRFRWLTGEIGRSVARVLYGLALLPFGIAHFTYLQRTLDVVPGWLPWHLGWAYFTGIAFIAAGVAVLVGVWSRLAATLSVVQMALLTVLVWVPDLVTGPDTLQWNEFLNSVQLTAGAWLVAESYRGVPWLAVGRRSAAAAVAGLDAA